jgi:Tfp pilus assembly protein PilO
MNSSNRLIVSILGVAAIAIAFWMLALGPKREEADELSGQVSQQQASLAEAQAQVTEAVAAKREFPTDYRQLVVLGQAAPAEGETASLLVQLSHIAKDSKVKFESIALSDEGGEEAAAPVPAPTAPTAEAAPSGVPAAATVPPTEAAASLTPLGASIGPAGLAVMPYSLTFSGNFFNIADFIKGIDSLVDSGGESEVAVDGRLVTLNGFALNAASEGGFPRLNASFAVTTYITPPNQGVTAGATPTAPAPSVATPAAATTSTETATASTSPETEPAQ